MGKSKKGGLLGRRKRALARLEIALSSTPKTEATKIARMTQEIATLKSRCSVA